MLKKYLFLFDSAPADGNGPPETHAAPAAAPAAPPPATKIVVSGEIDERVVDLQEQLDSARRQITTTEQQKKDRELTIAQLQDQLRGFTHPAKPAPDDGRSALERFMAGEDV